jgi:hypothetical protein
MLSVKGILRSWVIGVVATALMVDDKRGRVAKERTESVPAVELSGAPQVFRASKARRDQFSTLSRNFTIYTI